MAMEGATFLLVATQVVTTAENRENKLTDAPFVEVPGGGSAMVFGSDGAPRVEPLPPGEKGIP